MSKTKTDAPPPAAAGTEPKPARPQARLPKGLRDIAADELRQQQDMLARIRAVYERYGFEPLETPAFEYTDALGKFLPDQDRPNEGVFSLKDEDEQWLSLRYDLTAPLARYVAENFATLPKPFRRYAVGPVWRNEKPGPGRFRQFMQFDADTVGSDSVAADAEMCMLAADTLEALGIKRGQYVIKVSNRKILDGLREAVGLGDAQNDARWLTVMRAVDKYDRLGLDGVRALLTTGRADDSGDFTPGAGLDGRTASLILRQLLGSSEVWTPVGAGQAMVVGDELIQRKSNQDCYWNNESGLNTLAVGIRGTESGEQAVADLRELFRLCRAAGYGSHRIRLASETVRGLEYYTGPVFEAELTFEVKDDKGQPVRFGSVGGGGRYDDLVARFTGEKVPATGFSIGVSRLQAALAALNKGGAAKADGPVVVLVMDKAELPRYQKLVQTLRSAGIRAEMYLGSAGMKAQMKYADKRGAPCVVIQGGDEIAKGEVTLKDLVEGAKAAAAIKDNKEWKAARPAQVSIAVEKLVEAVREILSRHATV